MNLTTAVRDSRRALSFAAITLLSSGIVLVCHSSVILLNDYVLGIAVWPMLLLMLREESVETRAQVMVAVVFATAGEYFACSIMGYYYYQIDRIPFYVPPGHGMVYLTALSLGRSHLFARYNRPLTGLVLVAGSAWALWGVTLAQRGDALGASLFAIFAVFVIFSPLRLIYVATFFLTTYLEFVATTFATWTWVEREPVLHLTQGNPPAGVAGLYGLVDLVAITCALQLTRISRLRYLLSANRQAG